MKILKTAKYKKADFMEEPPEWWGGDEYSGKYQEDPEMMQSSGDKIYRNIINAISKEIREPQITDWTVPPDIRNILDRVQAWIEKFPHDKMEEELYGDYNRSMMEEDQAHIDAERANEQHFENRGVDPYYDRPGE
jgi:hypothetical protein